MRINVFRITAVFLMLFTGSALAGGGVWKIGPFGPYWDDNDWPEFTPMYWMEEFMNRLDDDDDGILDWMRMNQNSGQVQQGSLPERSSPAWNSPSSPLSEPDYYQSGPRRNDRIRPNYYQSEPRRNDRVRPNYYRSEPRRNDQAGNSRREPYQRNDRLPELTPEEFERMPRQLQREYERAFMDRYFPNNRGRREIDTRRDKSRSYRPQRRSKKSACFLR
jgi:hypothetical protein